jgi:hypothetical protein
MKCVHSGLTLSALRGNRVGVEVNNKYLIAIYCGSALKLFR